MKTGLKSIFAAALLCAFQSMAAGPTVEIDNIIPHYPWTNTVEVTYRIAGITNKNFSVAFVARNGATVVGSVTNKCDQSGAAEVVRTATLPLAPDVVGAVGITPYLFRTPGLPDGCVKVQYLYAVSGQWVSTGVNYKGHRVLMGFRLSSGSDSDIFLWGTYGAGHPMVTPWKNRYSVGLLGSVADYQGPTLDGNYHEIDYNPTAQKFLVDGTSYTSLPALSNYTSYSYTQSVIQIGNRGVSSASGFRYFYFIKIWDAAGTLVFDGTPVRKGAVGYIYDNVSKKLFGNSGSGNFTLGPDVAD